MLRCLQINLHHSSTASAELLLTLNEEEADLALVQEPWVSAGGNIKGLSSSKYRLFFAQGEGKKRSAILAKKELNINLCSNFSTNDQTVVLCEVGKDERQLLIASTYMAHEKEVPPAELRSLVEEAKNRKLNLVIGGDVNAHHTIWGSRDVNDRGESLLHYILTTNLVIGNLGNVPTYKGPTSENVLDITLYTETDSCGLTDWRVLDRPSLSDHCYIRFNVHATVTKTNPKGFRNVAKTNWDKFSSIVHDKLGERCPAAIWSTHYLDSAVNQVTTCLNEAFQRACPLCRPRKNAQPHWWNSDLRETRRRVRALFRLARMSNQEVEWSNYRAALRDFKKQIRSAKRKNWSLYCEQIQKTSETARLRKLISKGPTQPTLLCNGDGTWTKDSRETLEVLLDTHFPGCRNREPEGIATNRSSRRYNTTGIISENRVRWAIKSFAPDRSPGPDGIMPVMLHKVLDLVVPWLTVIFRGCLRMNHVPETWNLARVVFIPKAGKCGHATPKDYRPISLTSFLLKALERVLDSYIRENLNPGLLSKAQHAYTKGKSVETALHEVVFEIEKSLHYKEYTLGTFTDIEGAFNNATTDAIMEALEVAEVNRTICSWIAVLLRNRKITSEWGGVSLTKSVDRGTPQGGVLSPLLWLLVLNEILMTLEKEGVKVVAYADDVVILVSGKCLNTISEISERALRKLSSWAGYRGLSINPRKTELVLFTRRYKVPSFRTPGLEGARLELKPHAKYLGLILDSKLTWKHNVEERIAKANKALYTCKRLIGTKWGLKPHITHWVYTAIVRPILLYGVLVWWPAVEKKTYLSRMERTQRAAGISITGALNTTPSRALDAILHLPPVDLYAKNSATGALLRLKELGLLKTRGYGHSSLGENLKITTDYMSPAKDFNRKFVVEIPDRLFWESGTAEPANAVNIYTDGSKTKSGVGAAVYCYELDIRSSYRLPSDCSIFQAEAAAIHKAAEQAHSLLATGSAINIYVDSQAVLKALGSNEFRSKCLYNCYIALQTLSTGRKVRLCWVPGHTGIAGNEVADVLAKEGADSEALALLQLSPPLQAIKKSLNDNLWYLAKRRWDDTTTCRITKIMWRTYDEKKTNNLLSLTRAQCRLVVGVYTGHCLTGVHAFRIGVSDNELCRHCQAPDAKETIEHLLCHCPALAVTRHKLLDKYFFSNLEEVSKVSMRSILNFATKTGSFDLNRRNP